MTAQSTDTNMTTGNAVIVKLYLKTNKTHCINGHLFTPESSYISPKGYRACRICKKLTMRYQRTIHGYTY